MQTATVEQYYHGGKVWKSSYLDSIASGSNGSVSSVSVANANGFSGTVATATTTPEISLGTTVTGILKGNGTSVSAAIEGTDYGDVYLAKTQTLTGVNTFNSSVSATAGLALGQKITGTLTATANSNELVALDLKPTFNEGAFTSVNPLIFRASDDTKVRTTLAKTGIQKWFLQSASGIETGSIQFGTPANSPGIIFYNLSGTGRSQIKQHVSTGGLGFGTTTTSGIPNTQMVIYPTGSVLIQNGGTQIDSGYRLDVKGTLRATDETTLSNLAGTGTRMVVADSAGVLSTQELEPNSMFENYTIQNAGFGSTSMSNLGGTQGYGTTNGTATAVTWSSTNTLTRSRRIEVPLTDTVGQSGVNMRSNSKYLWRGNEVTPPGAAPIGGFDAVFEFGFPALAPGGVGFMYAGLTSAATSGIVSSEATAVANSLGVGKDAADGMFMHFIYNDGSGSGQKVATTIPITNSALYRLRIIAPSNGTTVTMTLTNLETGQTDTFTTGTTGIPSNTTELGWTMYNNNGTSNNMVKVAFSKFAAKHGN